MALKFEGKFKVGDQIKAYDFFPPHKGAEKDPYHFIGTVFNTGFVHPLEQWRGLEAVCTVDNGHGGADPQYSRVGYIVRVPYQTLFEDEDELCVDRIQLVKGNE